MPPQDEGALIGEARRGSAAAFEELARRYDAGVLRLALRMVQSEEEARDIYQETFLKAYRSIREFRGECSFRTWLFRIVANLCRDQARRRAARRDEPLPVPVGDRGDDWTVEAARLLVDRRPGSDPEKVLEASEVRSRVGEAVRSLPERERLVFELRHDQDLRLTVVEAPLPRSHDNRELLKELGLQAEPATSVDAISARASRPGLCCPPRTTRHIRTAPGFMPDQPAQITPEVRGFWPCRENPDWESFPPVRGLGARPTLSRSHSVPTEARRGRPPSES